jgi:hypothetical protein
MQLTYGFPTSEWETARSWVRERLREVAGVQSTITYSELCREISTALGTRLEPHGTPLAGLLGQVNVLEREEQRPLISCVVVHKSGDWKPGLGFWNMAKEMGLDVGTTDAERDRYWVEELKRCYAAWSHR